MTVDRDSAPAARRLGAPLVFMSQDSDSVTVHAVSCGEVAVYSNRCPEKPTANEDAAAVIPCPAGRAVLAVADGVGGLQGGVRAAATVVSCLRDTIERLSPDTQNLRGAIEAAIRRANRTILGFDFRSGTTIAVVEVGRDYMRPYHAGDSDIFVAGQRGKLKFKSVAHSPVGQAIDAGLIDEDAAMRHADRHVVSNVLGMPDLHIEAGDPVPLAPHDRVLITSDGLVDNLRTSETVATMCCGKLHEAAEKLARDVRERMLCRKDTATQKRGKPDDLTFLLFQPRAS